LPWYELIEILLQLLPITTVENMPGAVKYRVLKVSRFYNRLQKREVQEGATAIGFAFGGGFIKRPALN
jgi:hypothetical protein